MAHADYICIENGSYQSNPTPHRFRTGHSERQNNLPRKGGAEVNTDYKPVADRGQLPYRPIDGLGRGRRRVGAEVSVPAVLVPLAPAGTDREVEAHGANADFALSRANGAFSSTVDR
jgi:hypothetical protein